jgi:hypothetical protein
LRFLSGDEWDWRNTLQFRAGQTRYILFHYPEKRLRRLGVEFQGLRVHAGTPILMPPSVIGGGIRLAFCNPGACIEKAPEWLMASLANAKDAQMTETTHYPARRDVFAA